MNKIYFNKQLTGLVFMAFTMFSCDKLIEIPTSPSSMTQEEQYSDSLTTLSAVTGVYAINNGGPGFAYNDARLTYLTGFSADELSSTLVNDNQQFFTYTITPLNAGPNSLWSSAYRAIYQVNAVLENVSGNTNLTASFQNQIIGEMKVVRALYYFNLVNMFGKVPLITSTNYAVTSKLPRSAVDQVYSQIFSDLQDAVKLLKPTYPSTGKARPNLYTAKALQAKVNLYQEKWQDAYNQADSVIRFGGYNLVTNGLTNVFLNGSTEAIWQLPGALAFGNGLPDATTFVPYSPTAAANYRITPFLINAFEESDKRKENWLGLQKIVTNGVEQTIYYPFKYKNRLSSITPAEDQMVFRLAEMYLIRAEAAAHLNKLEEAIADVNILRNRAGLTVPISSVGLSQEDVIKVILHERQVEMFCEWGNRWFDLKRTGTAAAILGAEKTGFTESALLYPVPKPQIDLNPALDQNQGYIN